LQIGGLVEIFFIAKDTLSLEKNSIPDSGRYGSFEAELSEIELALANAMHQLDA
jgi:hypothetical protein